MHPRLPLAFLATGTQCWLMTAFGPLGFPGASLQSCFQQATPSLCCCWGFLPPLQGPYLPLWNSAVPSCPSFTERQLSCQRISHSPSFVSSADVLMVTQVTGECVEQGWALETPSYRLPAGLWSPASEICHSASSQSVRFLSPVSLIQAKCKVAVIYV